jgi:hypothetical protein
MPDARPIVTLLTDFGLDDPFVGIMKGVLLRHAPDAVMIDLTHAVAPQDVRGAAVRLEAATPWFPHQAVHLVVVDPGVGTARRAIAVTTESGHRFVAPDNGVLSLAMDRAGCAPREAVELPVPDGAAATFHGRDVFAPAAGRLAAGATIDQLGEPIEPASLVRLEPSPILELAGGALRLEVLTIDHFGNLMLNATPADVGLIGPTPRIGFELGGITIRGLHRTYGEVETGQAVAYVGSVGRIEIAIRNGSAAKRFEVSPGDAVEVRPLP